MARQTYEVVKANDAVNEWIVEYIDFESEGEIYAARFSGPGCEKRAKEYAEWMNEK